eukprot:9919549-Heterocapsa_arctica.AAC.1
MAAFPVCGLRSHLMFQLTRCAPLRAGSSAMRLRSLLTEMPPRRAYHVTCGGGVVPCKTDQSEGHKRRGGSWRVAPSARRRSEIG